ncbi:hypothetical protein AVEN_132307-1 [Araneus ventricosus]|uniref:Uncharacterized protein n=1 Tax=Araneus ventricosus TaxID=182803 RepID=A0A4Y2S9P3_ARAVE|nr:hypothetical protein AVEN_132307-1 [Araneus ventricosus]
MHVLTKSDTTSEIPIVTSTLKKFETTVGPLQVAMITWMPGESEGKCIALLTAPDSGLVSTPMNPEVVHNTPVAARVVSDGLLARRVSPVPFSKIGFLICS